MGSDLGFKKFAVWTRTKPGDEETGYEAVEGKEGAVQTVEERDRFAPY